MKKLIISLILSAGFMLNGFSQNNMNCTDSIISLIKKPHDKTKNIYNEVIKCDPYNFMLKCDSLAKSDKKYMRYAEKISYIYKWLAETILRSNIPFRKKLIDSHLIMLETGPYRSSDILINLVFRFKKEEFSKDDIERIINIYHKIKGQSLPFYYRLIGKLDIKNMISVLKNEQDKKYDKETKRVLTATLLRLEDKESTKKFLKSLDNRLLGGDKYNKKDIYEDLLMVHYMSNRKVYDKLFDLLESDTKIFIEHWSDEYGEGDTYWSINMLAYFILQDNIINFPQFKFENDQIELTKEQKDIISKWYKKNKNYVFEHEYLPNTIFRN